eukprot:7637272-Pyramimonas_sp.AAC.1
MAPRDPDYPERQRIIPPDPDIGYTQDARPRGGSVGTPPGAHVAAIASRLGGPRRARTNGHSSEGSLVGVADKTARILDQSPASPAL